MEPVASMPTEPKLRAGWGKAALTQVMRGDLLGEVLNRGKMGFGRPLWAWFRGRMAETAREVRLDRRTRERGPLEPGAVAGLLEEHRAGRRGRSGQIWSSRCLEEWACRWLDR